MDDDDEDDGTKDHPEAGRIPVKSVTKDHPALPPGRISAKGKQKEGGMGARQDRKPAATARKEGKGYLKETKASVMHRESRRQQGGSSDNQTDAKGKPVPKASRENGTSTTSSRKSNNRGNKAQIKPLNTKPARIRGRGCKPRERGKEREKEKFEQELSYLQELWELEDEDSD